MTQKESEDNLKSFLAKKNHFYPVNKDLLKTYSCAVCSSLLRCPHLLGACGHRVCSDCLHILMKNNNNPLCPADQNELDFKRVIPDKILEKEIEAINVVCFNALPGCPWTGSQNALIIHSEKCPYRIVPCALGCGMNGILGVYMKDHRLKQCRNAIIGCENCHQKVKRGDLDEHKEVHCPETKLHKCPENCGYVSKQGFPRKELAVHFENECPLHVSICAFAGAGCDFKGNKEAMNKHEINGVMKHKELVLKTTTKYLEDKQEEISILKRISELKKKVRVLSYLYERQYFWRIENFKQTFKDAQKLNHPEIKSPMISTCRIGYRLQITTLLYGEGCYQGHYMSLHARICPGEYDDILTWPFSQVITLTLLDQCPEADDRKHLPYTLDPKSIENKKAISKPNSKSKNPSFGTETFVKLEEMFLYNHYVVNDTIYILIEVHDLL